MQVWYSHASFLHAWCSHVWYVLSQLHVCLSHFWDYMTHKLPVCVQGANHLYYARVNVVCVFAHVYACSLRIVYVFMHTVRIFRNVYIHCRALEYCIDWLVNLYMICASAFSAYFLACMHTYCVNNFKVEGDFLALIRCCLLWTGEKGTKVEAKLCGCKYSNIKPYCDGTHVSLKADFDKLQSSQKWAQSFAQKSGIYSSNLWNQL